MSRREQLSDADEALYGRGASSAAYSHCGRAKTLVQIGVAFADAVLAAGQSR